MSADDLSQEIPNFEEDSDCENGQLTSKEHLALDLSVKQKQNTTENCEPTIVSSKRKTKPVKSTLLLKCVNDEDIPLLDPEESQLENYEDNFEEEVKNNSLEEFAYDDDSFVNENNTNDDTEAKNLDSFNSINFSQKISPVETKLKTKKASKQKILPIFKPPHAVDSPQSYNHVKNFSSSQSATNSNPKKQMRFQCRFCVYKSHSVSLMQNHIYRHIDTTPYSCYYCGHKSTTKSTIMVHIELCHPNMEVKIKESRVKEEDYYLDLNSSDAVKPDSMQCLKENKTVSSNKFEIMTRKNDDYHDISMKSKKSNNDPLLPSHHSLTTELPSLSSSLSTALSSSSSPSSSPSSLNSSPSTSPAPSKHLEQEQDPQFLQLHLNNEKNQDGN